MQARTPNTGLIVVGADLPAPSGTNPNRCRHELHGDDEGIGGAGVEDRPVPTQRLEVRNAARGALSRE